MSARRTWLVVFASCGLCASAEVWAQEATPSSPDAETDRREASREADDARTESARDADERFDDESSNDEREPIVVRRSTLNEEPPLTREEAQRLGPLRPLDRRQMLFEPGEPVERSEDETAERVRAEVEQGMIDRRTRQQRKAEIYERLRRVMGLGRSPR